MEQATEKRYRDQVQRVFNRISLTGLPERDPGLSELPLDRVFISLSVEVRRVVTDLRFRLVEADRPDGASAPDAGHPEELRRGDRLSLGPPPAPESVKLSVGQALSQYRRLIIVGDPGSGKTTLLRWLAVTFAAGRQTDADRLGPTFTEPCLPILLELRRCAERLRTLAEQPSAFDLADEISTYVAQDARFAGMPREAIRAAIAAGGCLILLDGLDEIEDRQARTRLIEAIEALYLDPRSNAANNLCLLTTRPHGFANISIGTEFQTATVRPFGRFDVAAFIRNWYRVAYGEHALTDEADQLVDAIGENERVGALATNPLLCTIIAVVFRNNRVLPDRRVELYFKCCDALLDTWERNRDIRDSGLIGGFGWQQKLELLATLAHWLHGENERLSAPEEAIVQRIAEALRAEHHSDPGGAEREARRFIAAIRDRSGLLRGRGDGSLEFSHRTFQEYLAARHIAALDEEAMIDAVMPGLHVAWWEEVHLLLFGELGGGKVGSGKVERLALTILDVSGKPMPFLVPPTHPALDPFWPGRWLPGWQLQQRVARLLGRDLILAVRGYGQCTATARSADLTERLKREIAALAAPPTQWSEK